MDSNLYAIIFCYYIFIIYNFIIYNILKLSCEQAETHTRAVCSFRSALTLTLTMVLWCTFCFDSLALVGCYAHTRIYIHNTI
eukprot:COSAG06_NODE_496_length_15043_cov_8.883565_5_plen_82_part_00